LKWFGALEPCIVAIEACGSAHYWGREIGRLGHAVRLVPAQYVTPFVKRGKTDAGDAEAICEAAGRPSMRFVPVKTVDNQAAGLLHSARSLLVKTRTMLINAVRGSLAEFGIVAAKGTDKLDDLRTKMDDACAQHMPDQVRRALAPLFEQIDQTTEKIHRLTLELKIYLKSSPLARRLMTIPGIGLLGATALSVMVPDVKHFRNGRHLAAWLGLTPKQNATGGKPRQGRISRAGDAYLRRLLVLGGTALVRSMKRGTSGMALWAQGLMQRRPAKVVAVALANKIARIVYALMATGEAFDPKRAVPIGDVAA